MCPHFLELAAVHLDGHELREIDSSAALIAPASNGPAIDPGLAGLGLHHDRFEVDRSERPALFSTPGAQAPVASP